MSGEELVEPPPPVRKSAKALTQKQLLSELARFDAVPSGFTYEDIEHLQKLYDAEYDAGISRLEAFLEAERQQRVNELERQSEAREEARHATKVRSELRNHEDVVNWTQLVAAGMAAKAASFCSRTPAIALHIAQTLTVATSPILSLELCRNAINDSVCKSIARMLATNTTLQLLNISSNCIGAAGLQRIATALQNNNTLKSLDISNNPLTQPSGPPRTRPSTVVAPATANSTSPSRHRARPPEDDPQQDYSGMKALKLALQTNTTLQVLNLQGCKLDGAANGRVVDALENNRTLVILTMDTTGLPVTYCAQLHRRMTENKRQRAARKAVEHKRRVARCKAVMIERLEKERQQKIQDEIEWARRNRMARLEKLQESIRQAAIAAQERASAKPGEGGAFHGMPSFSCCAHGVCTPILPCFLTTFESACQKQTTPRTGKTALLGQDLGPLRLVVHVRSARATRNARRKVANQEGKGKRKLSASPQSPSARVPGPRRLNRPKQLMNARDQTPGA